MQRTRCPPHSGLGRLADVIYQIHIYHRALPSTKTGMEMAHANHSQSMENEIKGDDDSKISNTADVMLLLND